MDVKEVENDALVIQGERRFEEEQNEGGMQRTERKCGLFYRSLLAARRAGCLGIGLLSGDMGKKNWSRLGLIGCIRIRPTCCPPG
jgi:hypothetical protein